MTIRKPNLPPRKDDGPRVNEQIRTDKIRLIGADGSQVGVVSVKEGLLAAEEAGLDLVEISPNADPPVCKVMDYGKFKYEQQKKANEARKKQKVIEIKEIKVRPTIEEHDYNVKMRSARRFLEEGNKVKVTLRYRGREMSHQELGMEILNRMCKELEDLGKLEMTPRTEGRQVMMILAPNA